MVTTVNIESIEHHTKIEREPFRALLIYSVRSFLYLRQESSSGRRWLWYQVYAWTCPLVFGGVSLIMEFAPSISSCYIKPNFGTYSCFFSCECRYDHLPLPHPPLTSLSSGFLALFILYYHYFLLVLNVFFLLSTSLFPFTSFSFTSPHYSASRDTIIMLVTKYELSCASLSMPCNHQIIILLRNEHVNLNKVEEIM